ncbi:MAG TPA: hypothetical protein VMU77_01475 [Acidimicrobiales bacterium]|nr:hypothetical protein [Acidimicrobiales bacterium]
MLQGNLFHEFTLTFGLDEMQLEDLSRDANIKALPLSSDGSSCNLTVSYEL